MPQIPDDWTEEQRAMFSKLYRFMVTNPDAMRHPLAEMPEPEHWQTVCHNAAFAAAEFMECDSLTISDFSGAVIATTPWLVS